MASKYPGKVMYYRLLGFEFEEKRGWHIVVGNQASNVLDYPTYIRFMNKLGWQSNLNGMHHCW